MNRPVVTAAMLWALLSTAASAQREPSNIRWNNTDGPAIPGVEHSSFRSESMDIEVGYNVYLPEGYAAGTQRYPVIWFLHGAGGNENSDASGFAGLVAGQIAAGKIPPVVCVFPNGGMSGYRDRPDSGVMGETLIVKELLPLIDEKYRTLADPRGRTIGGFSMGGGGAVRLGLKRPDLFSAAGSWAGALRIRDSVPPELEPDHLRDIKSRMRLLLIVGDQDQTRAGHEPLLAALGEAGFPVTFKELPGVGHDLGKYYGQTGEQMVQFLTEGFERPATP